MHPIDLAALDEAQCPPETPLNALLRSYMERTGWALEGTWRWKPENPALSPIEAWVKDGWGVQIAGCDYTDWLDTAARAAHSVARQEGRPVTTVLREVNPRMRGFPSKAAREAHPGLWIARSARMKRNEEPEARAHAGIGRFQFASACRGLAYPTLFWHWDSGGGESFNAADNGELDDDGDFVREWRFWPCDELGNKVRWPSAGGQPLW